MAEFIEIKGGKPLSGTVVASGAKNAALPQLIAALLTSDECEFSNVPNLEDVSLTISLLKHFGASVERCSDVVRVKVPALRASEASYSLVKALRASFWVLAPILARGGAARVALPGGDAIGTRPVNIHLDALSRMGADIKLKHGVVLATAPKGLKPAEVNFAFPSVGATHQILMAAALTPGRTVIRGAAREPEVVALADMLAAMGADICGAGSNEIEICGVDQLGGVKLRLIGDRIEAGTYLLAAVATRGSATVTGISPEFFGEFLDSLGEIGASVVRGDDWVSVAATKNMQSADVSTAPFPGFATDMQATMMAFLSTVPGVSTIEENVFEARYAHASELARMGADIEIEDRVARISGVVRLSGAPVDGYDIRGAAALVVAGLAAEGTTRIHEVHHLRRGYEALEQKLSTLGAVIGHRPGEIDDLTFLGC